MPRSSHSVRSDPSSTTKPPQPTCTQAGSILPSVIKGKRRHWPDASCGGPGVRQFHLALRGEPVRPAIPTDAGILRRQRRLERECPQVGRFAARHRAAPEVVRRGVLGRALADRGALRPQPEDPAVGIDEPRVRGSAMRPLVRQVRLTEVVVGGHVLGIAGTRQHLAGGDEDVVEHPLPVTAPDRDAAAGCPPPCCARSGSGRRPPGRRR